MAGLYAPLPTLHRLPRGRQRTARGRCGSLLLHRDGLSPSPPRRLPAHTVYFPRAAAATPSCLFAELPAIRQFTVGDCWVPVSSAACRLQSVVGRVKSAIAIFW